MQAATPEGQGQNPENPQASPESTAEGAGAAEGTKAAATPPWAKAHASTPSGVPTSSVEISTDVGKAAAILRAGGLVAIPTETVYGLACDARNAEALKRLYKVKGRPGSHPVIVHVADASALGDWGRDVPEYAQKLAERFWPGPLTLVVKRSEGVPDAVTGGQDTVGIRMPRHDMAQALLAALDQGQAPRFGLAAPSANKFGRVSPTQAEHVRDLGDTIDLILDGGACEVGIESTIVDCTGEAPVILRPGKISAADIEACVGEAPTSFAAEGTHAPGTGTTRAPGTLPHHYAPRAKVRLLKRSGMIEAMANRQGGQRLAALALEIPVARLPAAQSVVVPAVASSYARTLYANLRQLDAAGADVILVEAPPETPAWAAVLDRLRRAATPETPKKKKGATLQEVEAAPVEAAGDEPAVEQALAEQPNAEQPAAGQPSADPQQPE
jgi:L-threonylcarbamoyladenylate synthase